ncbi:hypothetical protein L0156_11965 [bacterium]|nr:hypothetical protein [bacterium]
MEILVFFLAIALAFAAYKVIRWNARLVAFNVKSDRQRKFYIVLFLLLGIAAGVFFSGLIYSTSEKTKIMGFPIPAAGWERWGSGWVDFVGTITFPITTANFFFWVLTVQLFAALVLRANKRPRHRRARGQ